MKRGSKGLIFTSKERISKGWSRDKKYCVTDEQGARYLLRVSDPGEYERKEQEFYWMKQAAALGIPMCEPLEFGVCEEGVYSVQSWIEGVDAREVLDTMPDTRQYVYGLEAGRILRRIHSIEAPEKNGDGTPLEDWESRFGRKLDRNIRRYQECPLKYEGGQAFIDYVNEKYGHDHVAQIITFGTMAARAAIRDVGRVLGMPYAQVDSISKMVPMELKMTLRHALEVSPDLKNAIEHSPEGAKITVKVEENGVYTAIAVTNPGEPISREMERQIFRRYYSAARSADDNAGIGLPLAKAIVERQKGYLSVDSADGENTFTIKYLK